MIVTAVSLLTRKRRPVPELDIREAAKLIGRELMIERRIPHVVGAGLSYWASPALQRFWLVLELYRPKLRLYVYINSRTAKRNVPKWYKGHRVHVRLVVTPTFCAS